MSLRILEQAHALVHATADVIMGVYCIFKYANQQSFSRVTPGGVHLSMQMKSMIHIHKDRPACLKGKDFKDTTHGIDLYTTETTMRTTCFNIQ